MKKINKVLIAAVILFTAAGGALYSGPNLVISPQRQASAGQFWSDADLFVDPRGYTALEIDHMFALVSFDNSQMAKIGFSKWLGSLYLGVYYGGNMLNMVPHNYTKQTAGDAFFLSGREMRVYTAMPGYTSGNLPENNLSLLFGFLDMGVRLSFKSTYWNRTINEDFTVLGNYYKSFKDEYGSINPELAWGMTKELIPGLGIKPHIYLSVDFFRDYQRLEQYISAAEVQERLSKSNNVTTFELTAAMGALTLAAKETFEFGVDLWYNLSLPIYNNEYMYMDGTNAKIAGGYNGLYGGQAGGFAELSENRHVVTPYLYASWSGERITLSAELGLGLGFGWSRNTAMTLIANSGDLEKNGVESKKSYFEFTPALCLGMQWAVVPEKLFLNAGGELSFGNITLSSAESKEFENGKEKENTSAKTVDNVFSSALSTLSLGLTFNVTNNVSFQANCGVAANNVVNIFKSDSVGGSGFAVFSGILATVKF